MDATSTLTVGGPSYNFDVSVVLNASATAQIFGTVYLSPLSTSVHTRAYITAAAAGSLVFESGAACHITDSTASSGFNASVAGGIVFKSGASLYYYSGRSPIGSNQATEFTNFQPGSNLYIRGNNRSYIDGVTTYSTSAWTNAKTFANIFMQNNSTWIADGAPYKIENFTIDAGCTFSTHTTGNTPVLGNLIVNGTLNSNAGATTNSINMGGDLPQTISGSGVIDIRSFSVANHSNVTLQKNITVANTVNIVGKLTFEGTSQIMGLAAFTSRANGSALDATGNLAAGSFLVTGASALTGNTGLAVTCTTPGVLSPNTNCIGFGTGFIYLSKPALTNASGVTFQFRSDSATLTTSNPNGFNPITGSVTTTGARSFQSGTNYVINAATTQPFGVSDGNTNALTGNVTLNAPVTTNYTTRVSGTLTLNSGILTVRSSDTLRLTSATTVAGAPFSSTKYIALQKSGANVGTVRFDGFNTAKLFPVGSSTNYMPVTLTPTVVDTFAVNVFEGITTDGTANGTAMSAPQKAKVVDAVWTINRVGSAAGDCVVNVAWPESLEGSSFAGLGNNIGIGKYNGAAWDVVAGTGNNTTNTASNTYSSFSPFGVGEVGFVLPVKITSLSAKAETNVIKVNWTVDKEINVSKYVVEKSSNGFNFSVIATIDANNSNQYIAQDASPFNLNYYRIKIVSKNNSVDYSNVISVRLGNTKGDVTIYPNPIKGNLFNVQLSNVEKGKVSVNVYDVIGKLVSTNTFTYAGSTSLHPVLLPSNTAKGMYNIVVNVNGKTITQKTVFVD
ncbi:MAG: T9SS type A sorting domain-containing protein [Chitinophagaceae bacterium]|nr:T9SS type A sorting domain-containing protein [Chitinophagaceae bacterium]MBP9740991.1 T9SS type A sorting domain-containing protein [Chitinophagaceae bacterium]